MSEPELTPQILAGLFAPKGKPEAGAAGTEQTGEQGQETSIEQPQGSRDALTDDQTELATRYGLTAQEARRVRGRTWAEKCEDAERLAAIVRQQPNRGELAALSIGKGHHQAILDLFHPIDDKDGEDS